MEKVQENAKMTVATVAKKNVKLKKVVSAIVSAGLAVTCVAVTAFAEETGAAGVDYSGISSTILGSFKECITQCLAIATAILPLGLGLYIVGKMWDVAKKFFTKATN